MIEIELPCCQSVVRVDALGDTIRCDACGIEIDVADAAPEPVRAAA